MPVSTECAAALLSFSYPSLMYYNCPHARLSSPSSHAFTLGEITAFKNQTSVHNSAFLAAPPTEYERKRVFFIPPSVGSCSSPGKSFCILKYLASLGFANPLSVNVMLFLNFSLPQYI